MILTKVSLACIVAAVTAGVVAPCATATPTAPNTSAPAEYKRYLTNNTYAGVWQDDGVKGQVKNFSTKRIVVRDTVMDKKVDIWPGQTVVFYSDRDLVKFGSLDAGDGTWIEISDYGNPHALSEIRLSDAWLGRPDTLYWGPGRKIQNQREGWNVGESHHEITPTHKMWIKREADTWTDKHDTWNTRDWAAFTIHVDSL